MSLPAWSVQFLSILIHENLRESYPLPSRSESRLPSSVTSFPKCTGNMGLKKELLSQLWLQQLPWAKRHICSGLLCQGVEWECHCFNQNHPGNSHCWWKWCKCSQSFMDAVPQNPEMSLISLYWRYARSHMLIIPFGFCEKRHNVCRDELLWFHIEYVMTV